MEIRNARQLRDAIANGPYAWPGGYPLFFVMQDGESLCFDCAKRHRGYLAAELSALRKTGSPTYPEWCPAAADINYEDDDEWCAHCYRRIECAYCDDEPEPAATVSHIGIRRLSGSDLFHGWQDGTDGIDTDASAASYQAAIVAALSERYPAAQVELVNHRQPFDSHLSVTADDERAEMVAHECFEEITRDLLARPEAWIVAGY